MDRRVTSPKRATSPTWGPHLHVNRLWKVEGRSGSSGMSLYELFLVLFKIPDPSAYA